jgi:hypothetical protein
MNVKIKDYKIYVASNICLALRGGDQRRGARGCQEDRAPPRGWGLHSFTFQLNLFAFCGIGGVFGGCSREVREYKWVFRVCFCVRNCSG